MAICASPNELNQIIANTTPVAECTAYILSDASDYLNQSVWQVPEIEMLSGFWMAGFVLPMSAHMIAWAVGSLVNFFNKD